MLRATGQMRNVRQLNHTYPRLGELLEGREQLPELPAIMPDGVNRLAAIGERP